MQQSKDLIADQLVHENDLFFAAVFERNTGEYIVIKYNEYTYCTLMRMYRLQFNCSLEYLFLFYCNLAAVFYTFLPQNFLGIYEAIRTRL